MPTFEDLCADHAQKQEAIEIAMGQHLGMLQVALGVDNGVCMGALLHLLLLGMIDGGLTNEQIIEHFNKVLPPAINEVRGLYDLAERKKH